MKYRLFLKKLLKCEKQLFCYTRINFGTEILWENVFLWRVFTIRFRVVADTNCDFDETVDLANLFIYHIQQRKDRQLQEWDQLI